MIHRRRRTLAALLTTVVTVCAMVPSAAAQDDEPPGPITQSWTAALLYSFLLAPEANTPGANDWDCVPSAAHPRPVVLVHGTFENRYDDWAWMAPQLDAAGYCVFALNYGDDDNSLAGIPPSIKATGDIALSAQELAVFVDEVLAATGASQVDIVGHSQGGMMPRQYMKFEGGANPDEPSQNKVHTLVTLGATHHGTTADGLLTLADAVGLLAGFEPVLGTAVVQQYAGSEFLANLNAGGDTMPGVRYVVIATKYDLVSTPYNASFLTAGPGATVKNITLQTGCPLDLSSHTSMVTSNRAIDLVKNGLDPAHPVTPRCQLHLPEV